MPRPCFREHPEPEPDGCRFCQLYLSSAKYRDHWDTTPELKPAGPCSHLGAATGGTIGCKTCKGRVELKLFSCDLHGTCTLAKPSPVTACCAGCKDYEATDRITLNMGAGGLGDAMQGLLAVDAVRAANPGCEIVYRTSSRTLPFVRLFDGYDRLQAHDWDHNASKTLAGPDRQLNAGFWAAEQKGGEPRIARYLRNAKAKNPGRPTLREPDRIRELGRDFAGVIALSPFSAWSDREYSRENWLTLEAALIAAGYSTVILHNSRERTEGFRSRLIVGESADRVAGVLLNAAAVIGIDSGLTHLAGLLGRPTLALMAQTDGPAVFGCYPSVRALAGGMPCGGCYWKTAAGHSKTKCKPSCPNINSIPTERIISELRDLIAGVPMLAVESEEARHLRELKAFAAVVPPYPGGEGDGIVTAGEGDYWPGVVILVRMLRRTGCTLPVECWHRPAAGRINPADVAGLDVTLREISEPIDGWAAKLHGLSRSRFARAIWIDADCYPTRDPSPLLGLSSLAMFADRTPEATQHLKWDRVFPGGERGVRWNAGQFVIDRRIAWAELAVTNWIAEHSAYYWRHMLGDNDAWTVACAALGKRPDELGEIEKLPQAKHLFRFACPEAEFIHRSGPKLIPLGVPGEAETLRILADAIDAAEFMPPPLTWNRPVPAETTKAYPRRVRDGFFERFVRLPGIDIGCGGDLFHPGFHGWDLARGDGDAAFMELIPDGMFATVYASHILEHMPDPAAALRSWWRILRPGGRLIVCVPHRDLYERRLTLPSRFNADHRTFWLPDRSENKFTLGLREMLEPLGGEIELLEVRSEGWGPCEPHLHAGGEYQIEAVVRKP